MDTWIETVEWSEAQERADAMRREMVVNRTSRHLGEMPTLAAAMITNARTVDHAGGGSKPGSRVPPELVGVEALDDLWTMLANWATSIASTLDVRPPAVLQPHADADRDVNGFPVAAREVMRIHYVLAVADWLRAHLIEIDELVLAPDFHQEVDERMRGWLALFPLDPPPLRVKEHPCPVCKRDALVVHMSEHAGHHDDYRVECSHCGERVLSDLRAVKDHEEGCPGCVAAETNEGEKR